MLGLYLIYVSDRDPWCKYAYNMDLLVFSKHSEQTPLNSPMRGK